MAISKIVIDTNVYSGILKGAIDHQSIFEKFDHIIIPTIVIGELRAGFALGKKSKQNEADLQQILNNNNIKVLAPEISTTSYYAAIYKALRKKGKPIPTNDIWIAAICLEQDAQMATLDRHFNFVADLKIYGFE